MRRRRSFRLVLPLLLAGTGTSVRGDDLPEPILSSDARFAIPVDVAAGESTAEVRLYVSDDAGAAWRLYRSAKPPLDSFEFAASGEKEYWFHVRTTDAAGTESPAGPMLPELRVIVDRTPPKLELNAERTADGGVVVRWKLDDPHAAPDSLKLSYRSMAGGSQPRDIAPTRSKRQGDDRNAAGEVQWLPDDAGKLVVRAEAADRAENRASTEIVVSEAAGPGVTLPRAAAGPSPAVTQLPSVPTTSGAALPAAAPAAAPPRDPSLPLMVNSKSFELDYDLNRAAAGPATKVEVWGTRDDGRTWVPLGVDEDRRSPTAVTVDEEGLYGFAIVVETAAGPATAPRGGDAPEIRVGVDLTVPRVRLTTAEPDDENRPCTLKIRWEAHDPNLGPQAVSLSYAATPQGPWIPLAVGVANTGSAACRFDPLGPDFAYLKLDVRDEAGNVGTFTTTASIPIDKRPAPPQVAQLQRADGKKSGPRWYHVLR